MDDKNKSRMPTEVWEEMLEIRLRGLTPLESYEVLEEIIARIEAAADEPAA